MGIHLRNNLLKKTSGKELIQELPLEEKDNWHIVVLNDEQVVGTLMLSKKSKKTAQIEQVAICESMQGLGVGKQLIDFAEAVASDLGFKQTYLTGRESAWAFYEKLGYTTNHKISKIGRVRIKEYTKKLVAHEMVKEMETNG
ncbi:MULTISPECIES: GNAT family N-acetyltransferase [Vagococcus]|uniref:GNAT family N-acetyltransferase n=1 Tax=Vagococcus TaxID=2737 RepID=UPI002FC65822